MKNVILLLLAMCLTVCASAQSWSGTTPGNIYYNSGNVGIGTTMPGEKLQVVGNITVSSGALIGSTQTDNSTVNFVSGASMNTRSGIILHDSWNGSNSLGAYISMFVGNGTGNNEAMRITTSGNIGIGTMSPIFTLDIGNGTGYKAIRLNGGIEPGGGAGAFYVNRVVATGSRQTIMGSGVSQDALMYAYDTNPLVLSTGGTDRLTILPSGNVGIGTTTPEAKLSVKGKIVASEIQVKEIGTIPDYVFKPNYKLMSLKHVEIYVKQNYHLPEVPSEKEFKENGMNMAEMNALLLKKIEELTLYAIAQNKEIEDLKRKMECILKNNQ